MHIILFDASISQTPPKQKQERRRYEDMADLYSIIKATEHLEAAFARDAVSQDDVRLFLGLCLYICMWV